MDHSYVRPQPCSVLSLASSCIILRPILPVLRTPCRVCSRWVIYSGFVSTVILAEYRNSVLLITCSRSYSGSSSVKSLCTRSPAGVAIPVEPCSAGPRDLSTRIEHPGLSIPSLCCGAYSPVYPCSYRIQNRKGARRHMQGGALAPPGFWFSVFYRTIGRV